MRKLRITLLLIALIAAWSDSVWATSGTLTITANMTLSEDHQGNIIIAANFLTLDCAGRMVTPPPPPAAAGTGIELIGRIGVTVQNCRVTGFEKGFVVAGSARNVFVRNRVERNTDEAFDLNGAIGNVFIDNIVNNCSDLITSGALLDYILLLQLGLHENRNPFLLALTENMLRFREKNLITSVSTRIT